VNPRAREAAPATGRKLGLPPLGAETTKHEELRERLTDLLESGLRPNDSLPSERELTERFGVSRATVRQALAELADRGLVYRVHGRGTFVAKPTVRRGMVLSSFTEDMASRGMAASSKVFEVRTEPAGAFVGQALGLSPAKLVVHVQRLRLADGEPMCVEESYLSKEVVGDIGQRLDDSSSLYQLLREKGIKLARAEEELKATVLSEREAGLLSVPPFSAGLLTVRVTYDRRGRRVEFAKSLYRGDRYSIELNICSP
jgi:GntR family transcriptional regulator